MKIAIAEDDACFADRLQEFIGQFAAEHQFQVEIRRFADGASLVEAYDYTFDLLLLDVDMPGLDGISTARQIRERDGEVLLIFITNLAQYAIKGYEVDALDYVLKPVSYYALSMKLKKALRILRGRDDRAIFLRQDGERRRLPVSRIYYVEVYGHSLCYHTMDGKIVPSGGQTMNQAERELGRYGFVRCHNGYLVNLRYVDGLGNAALQVAGDTLPVSRNRKKALLEAIMNETIGGPAE